MAPVLTALKGARLIAKGQDGQTKVCHYLLADGRVIEVLS